MAKGAERRRNPRYVRRKEISTMKKRTFLLAKLVLFMTVCLLPAALFTQENPEGGAVTEDGRKMSQEAHNALLEASRRYETDPDDLAAARQPLIEFLAAPQEGPIPVTLYQMLGQFWYSDKTNDRHTEEANRIYRIGHEAFPEDEVLLYNYAASTYELERFAEAAALFEKCYEQGETHDIRHLSNAAQLYASIEDYVNAKRLYSKMMGMVEVPEKAWLQNLIGICQMQDDMKETEKYIWLALKYYPMETQYWEYLYVICSQKEDLRGAAAALEIESEIHPPDSDREWQRLIDLYNYNDLYLRSAESIQSGLDLLAAESTEVEQQLAVAKAYARGARVDKAVSYLDSAIAKNPNYDLKLKKAAILYDARRNLEALAALEDCIKERSNAYDAYYMKGWIAMDLKDWDTAKDAFTEASNSREEIIRYASEDVLERLAGLEKAKNQ